MVDHKSALELHDPHTNCGSCRFVTSLSGAWSIEDGRLVWRADPNPQQRRGPKLRGCYEGYGKPVEFNKIIDECGRNLFTHAQLEELRATAEKNQ